MKVFSIILQLRVKQFYRILSELGVVHLIVLSIAVIPLFLMIWSNIEQQDDIVLPLIMGFILFSIHLNRKDTDFLLMVFPRPATIFFIEYCFVLIPAIALMLVRNRLDIIVGMLCLTAILAFLRINISRKNTGKPLFRLPEHFQQDFEWISGLRKQYLSIALIYIAGVGLSWWSPAIPLVAMFLLGILVATFYMEAEPHNMLETFVGQASRPFLIKKISRALTLFWMYVLPLILLFFSFHLEYWYVFIILFVIISLFPILGIVLKYSHYSPGVSLKSNELILGIMIAFLTMPFTQPVPMIFAYRQYKKALKNLNNYLDDPT